MKRQIELKELAAYLPYGLKIKTIYGEVETMELLGDNDIVTDKDEYSFVSINPILRPLSALKEPIEHEGEKFVPIDKLIELYGYTLETDESKQLLEPITLELYILIRQLLEWKFDCFSLIKDNLAVPVTKKFNPYK